MSSEWFSLPNFIAVINLFFTHAAFTGTALVPVLGRLVIHNLIASKLLVREIAARKSDSLVECAAWLTYGATCVLAFCACLQWLDLDMKPDSLLEMSRTVSIIGAFTAFLYGSIFLAHIE
ncbi:hypothetical protein JCM10207_005607 [Rhodosporidiobolus poonsookiae]